MELPTLTKHGCALDYKEILSRKFAYFIVSEPTRSFFFPEHIVSFKSIVASSSSELELINNLEHELTLYLNDSFDDIDVKCKKAVSDEGFSYAISIQVTGSNGNKVSLDETIDTNDGSILLPILNKFKDE